MKIRLISAFLAMPLLFLVLYFLPGWCLCFAIAVVTAASAYEILCVTKLAEKNKIALTLSLIMAAAIPLSAYYALPVSGVFCFLCFVCALSLVAFFDYGYMTFERICICFFTAVVIPLFLSGIVRISLLGNGIYFTIFPFVVAWCCDTAAYFSGRFLGRHKLAPLISPKKTIEGAVGGLAGGMIGMAVTGFIMGYFFHKTPDYFALLVLGGICAVVSQIGDLFMSLIKRNYDTKDYGSIMPGHGGVLDRFDSVIFATPAVEAMLLVFPRILG